MTRNENIDQYTKEDLVDIIKDLENLLVTYQKTIEIFEEELNEAVNESLEQAKIVGRHIDDMDKCNMEKRALEIELEKMTLEKDRLYKLNGKMLGDFNRERDELNAKLHKSEASLDDASLHVQTWVDALNRCKTMLAKEIKRNNELRGLLDCADNETHVLALAQIRSIAVETPCNCGPDGDNMCSMCEVAAIADSALAKRDGGA